VPVLEETEKGIVLNDSTAICEYFEETVDKAPMINGSALNRAEIRRLVALFEENLFGDVTMPMMHERMKKRLVTREPPDSRILREAMKLAHAHLDYLDWLLDHRAWLAGPQMSLADIAAAAQLSVADYLGGIDWKDHQPTRDWYAAFKSRPSFGPLLADKMDVIQPPAHYAQLDD
jgi:glutathione S-transferase